jgi:protein involved in polysaccharide export with SLBB domain
MIGIRLILKNQLTLLMGFLMIFTTLQPIRQTVYAESPNPGEPPQQRSSVSFNRQTFKAGDAVQISVYPDTSSFLHNVFPIDGDGYIFLPIVGKTKIVNMTEQEFIAFINDNFTQYLRTPVVQVRPLIRASLLGGFIRPNLYYVDPDQTLWDLIHRAGGTLSEDGLKKMRWTRDNKTIGSNLISYYQSGKSLSQIGFRSGDQIWTPSPSQRNFWDNVVRYVLPVATLGISIYTVYLTTQLRLR